MMRILKEKLAIISVMMFCLAMTLVIDRAFIVCICACSVLLCQRELKWQSRICLTVFEAALSLGVLSSIIKFNFLPQAEALLESNTNLLYWFNEGHIHAIRLLISYPGYVISEGFNLSLDDGFTIYVCVVFSVIYILLIKMLHLLQNDNLMSQVCIIGLLLLLAVVMNGRIVFSYCGLTILLYDDLRDFYRQSQGSLGGRFLRMMIGVVLTTVSSGTMLLTVGYVGLINIIKFSLFLDTKKKIVYGSWFVVFLCVFVPIWIVPIKYIWKMIEKNVNFFGGGLNGLVGMLEHGLGKIFVVLRVEEFIVLYLAIGILIIVINVLLFVLLAIHSCRKDIPLLLATNMAVYGAMVGISTGTMAIIPLAILCLVFIEKRSVHLFYKATASTGEK